MIQRLTAELIGTFILVFAGAGAIMVNDVSGGEVTHLGIGLSFGLAVAIVIYAIGHLSGAHINPAVTAAFAVVRRFPWKEVPAYWGAQLLGAVLAGLALRGLLGLVAGMGATVPSGTWRQSFGFEIVLSFILMFVIMAVAVDRRARLGAPLAVGGAVALEATFAGPISGASMNPARSFGPALAGGPWDSHWIYWVAPLVGMVAAALIYEFCWRGKIGFRPTGAFAEDMKEGA